MNTATIAKTLSGIYRLLGIAFALCVLYFAQSLVIPLTVAALLTFLLSYLVTYLERWVGRLAAIFLAVLVSFSIIGVIGYVFAKQLIEFGTQFPSYIQIIQAKLKTFHFSGEIFNKLNTYLENVKFDLFGASAPVDQADSQVNVKWIDLSSHLTRFIELIVSSLFNLLSMAGIILLLVIFMLFNHEDIRSRIIKLMGQSRISSTTSAMRAASDRVTSYLFRLLVVNAIFGFLFFVGLTIIGIPNPILWGCLAGILRFIPYIGAWIAALIPIALSFIITDSWMTPLFTIGFFIILEIVTAYGIEPLYYGGGTGVSAFALILAALFWTWMWGPLGLLLSTPLTVCLVVLGQYVTNMNFLRVLLSQEQPLTPAEECYHRLLLKDSGESMDLIESYLQKNSLVSVHEEVLLPIIFQTEKDFRLDLIDAEKKGDVFQSLREILEYLELNEQKEEDTVIKNQSKILCLPSNTLRDELGATILEQALSTKGFSVNPVKKLNLTEAYALIEQEKPRTLFIVAVAPTLLSHTRFLSSKIAQHYPQLPLIICLLGSPELEEAALEKFNLSDTSKVVYTLAQALKVLDEANQN